MKLSRASISTIIVASCTAAYCQKATVTTAPQQPFVAPSYSSTGHHPEVAAFYYAWYVQNQWACLLDMVPSLGEYDSRNLQTIDDHMNWASQAGLDDLILSWWGTNNPEGQRIDGIVPNLLEAAAAYNIKMPIMIDAYDGRTPATVANDVAYLMKQYSAYPAWYTSERPTPFLNNSKPKSVFLLYSTSSTAGVKPSDWTAVIDNIHQKYGAAVLIHDNYDPTWVTVGHFDGMFGYGTYSTFNERELAQSLPPNAWYLPTCYPGFNAYRSKGWTGIVPRNGGDTYNQTWFSALDLGNDMPMVAVTSFNEWTETTQIEPDGSGVAPDRFTYETYGNLGATGYLSLTSSWATAAHDFTPVNYANAATVYEIPGIPNNDDNGLWQNSWGNLGVNYNEIVGGRPAVSCEPGSDAIYYQVDRSFAPPGAATYTVRVDYFDSGTDKWRLDYRQPNNVGYSSPYVTMTGTNEWRTATFTISNAQFTGQFGGYDDLRVFVPVGSRDSFGLVSVTLVSSPTKSRRAK